MPLSDLIHADLGAELGLIEQIDSIQAMLSDPNPYAAVPRRGDDAEQAIGEARIAIADDERANVRIVQKHLELAGYRRFCTTQDGRTVVDLVTEQSPDVLLLDICMPHVSGLEILAEMKAKGLLEEVPVVILTASDDRSTKLRALGLGAADFLSKPVDVLELTTRLKNVLTIQAQRRRLQNHATELEREVAARTQELADAHREVVRCLAMAGEYRNCDTGEHVMRVGRYAEIVARRLGFPVSFCARLREAAQLHDIGKVGVPDSILLKPGKLDETELEVMRRHCDAGRRVCLPGSSEDLERLPSHVQLGHAIFGGAKSPILAMAATIAYSHHEKWDGSGYPQGLAGEAIPLEGRITAVADVFDALLSTRTYKKAHTLDEALAYLHNGRGKHFDPVILDAFLESLNEILEVRGAHAEPQGA